MTLATEHAEQENRSNRFALGAWGWALIVFGVATRLLLFASGRIPLDGDEGIMGVMALHLSRLERFPIFFYRQHYMGALEVPPVAFLMALGPEAWKLSVWPIRLVQLGFFIGLLIVHTKLAARFFGAHVARWALFFICVAPFYWVDYSFRLRHIVAMMLLGEAVALLALTILDRWETERRVEARKVFYLGLLIGLSWWHYQLVVVFLAGLIALVAAHPRWVKSWFARRSGAGEASGSAEPTSWAPSGWDGVALGATAAMAGVCIFLAGLSMEWGANWTIGYPAMIGSTLLVFVIAATWLWLKVRAERAPGAQAAFFAIDRRQIPMVLMKGFLLGYSPTIIYLFGLNEEFWVPTGGPSFTDFWVRLRNFFFFEFSALLEITTPVLGDGPEAHTINARSYINLALYLGALYCLIRELFIRSRGRRTAGAIYYLAILAALVLLHVVIPRRTSADSPRFLVPAFAVTSVGLGLLIEHALAPLRERLVAYRSAAMAAAAGAVVLASFALWSPNWMAARSHAMDWPSGHRRIVGEVLQALDEHDIRRIVTPKGIEDGLFGYELQFAGGLKTRFNRFAMIDRLEGIVDENQYTGPTYLMHRPEQRGREYPGGFWVGEYYIFQPPPKEGGGDYAYAINELRAFMRPWAADPLENAERDPN